MFPSSAFVSPSVVPGVAKGKAVRGVAVIWQRFGPYHLTRLRGAAEILAPFGWNVVGLEVAGADQYEWHLAADNAVERETLFPDRHYSMLPARTSDDR